MTLSLLSSDCLLQPLQLLSAPYLPRLLLHFFCRQSLQFLLLQDKLAEKLPPPALNRPPTQQRAPDPGRFRSIDMQPESAQQDPSYQRMMQEVSEGTTAWGRAETALLFAGGVWHVVQCDAPCFGLCAAPGWKLAMFLTNKQPQ